MFFTYLQSLCILTILGLAACSGAQTSLPNSSNLSAAPSGVGGPPAPDAAALSSTAKISSITLSLQSASPAQCGPTVTVPLTVVAKDATGKVITGTYASPINLSDSDTSGATKLSTATLTSSSTPVTVTYNGAAITSATFSASSSGVSASNVHVAVLTPSQLVYVANQGNGGNGSVTIFSAAAKGNVAPLRTIAGGNTKLNYPAGVAHDTQCNVYVSDYNQNKIFKFASGANGNVAPVATINLTSLGQPEQIVIGSTGKLYVAEVGGYIQEFAPGANGNAVPIATITSYAPCGDGSGLGNTYGIALDAQQNIYVSNESNNCIAVFAAGANGRSTPLRTIGGSKSGMDKSYGPYGVAIGPTGKIYLTLFSYYIGHHDLVYAAGASGNVSPLQNIVTSDSGYGIAVNSAGNIYISTLTNAIKVFAPNATGSATPVATIAGSNTKLNNPRFISI